MPAPAPSRHRLRAFTLIELIVVIVILGLLASIGAISYKAVLDRSQKAALTATGQSFLKEARALAAGDQAAPSTVAATAAGDLPDEWSHTQGSTDARKVRLDRGDGAWVCTVLPVDYTAPGIVSAVGLPGSSVPAADDCPTEAGGEGGGQGGALTPAPVSALSASRTAQAITITWDAAPEADTYEVVRDGQPMATTTATSHTDTAVVAAKAYTYGVLSVADGVKSVAAEITVEAGPLGEIAAVTASRGPGTVTLSWQAVPDAANYRVLRDGAELTTTDALTFTDSSAVNETAYLYTVTALAGDRTSPAKEVPVAPLAQTWSSLSAGMDYTAAVTSTGKLFTWGSDSVGQLGDGGANVAKNSPTQVRPDLTWRTVSTGASHTMAITTDGDLYAWGSDGFGELGDGDINNNHSTPTQILPGTKWNAVATGATHTIATTTGGQMFGWGEDTYGELGDGANSSPTRTPRAIGAGRTWDAVAAGVNHSMATTSDGELYTWGQDVYGGLGDGGSDADRYSPWPVMAGTTWQSITAGRYFSGGVTTDGKLYTWGYGGYSTLGTGSTATTGTPRQVMANLSWKSIDAGTQHMVAVTGDGQLYTWGQDLDGQLGDGGANTAKGTPVRVGADLKWSAGAGGGYHSVATTDDGKLFTWGRDSVGQLGDGGANTNQGAPVPVTLP